jgi:DNA-binding transcriptional LysR family regulator
MLNLYKLEIFNTVAMEGSFSKAAERLLLTQPAVSQHVRDLESGLSKALFERTPRGVKLTPAGEILLDYTRCILRLVTEAEQALTSLDRLEQGNIAIGATPSTSVYLLPGWIQDFHQRFPGLGILLRTDTTPNIAADILAGKLDLGFVEGELQPEARVNTMALQELELLVVVGAGHRFWERTQVSLRDLNGETFIARPPGSQTRAWIDQVLQQHGVLPRVIAEFDNPEAIKQAVTSGMGAAILPDLALQNEDQHKLHAIPIQEQDLRRTLKLVWAADGVLKPVSRAFLAQLSERYPALAQLQFSGRLLERILPDRDAYKASLGCKG